MRKLFTPVHNEPGILPSWAKNTLWTVMVNGNLTDSSVNNCAHQILGWFTKKFDERLSEGRLPWGEPKGFSIENEIITMQKSAAINYKVEPNDIAKRTDVFAVSNVQDGL